MLISCDTRLVSALVTAGFTEPLTSEAIAQSMAPLPGYIICAVTCWCRCFKDNNVAPMSEEELAQLQPASANEAETAAKPAAEGMLSLINHAAIMLTHVQGAAPASDTSTEPAKLPTAAVASKPSAKLVSHPFSIFNLVYVSPAPELGSPNFER